MNRKLSDPGAELLSRDGFRGAEKSILSPYTPYEDAHLESPLFRWTPRWFFACRTRILNPFRRPLFRIYSHEITVGGVIFWLAIYAVFITVGLTTFLGKYKDTKHAVHSTGDVTAFAVLFLFTIAGRNSIWTLILGVSYERAAIWHRAAAVVSLILIFCHATKAWNYPSYQFYIGLAMSCLFSFVILTSHLLIYCNLYRTFLVIHRLVTAALLVLIAIHGAGAAIVGGCVYLFDLLFRYFVSYKLRGMAVSVQASTSPDGFVTLSFPKGDFQYAAGQFVWVSVASVSCWEAHPFSISSSPYQGTVTIHIRPSGDWTKHLSRFCRAGRPLRMTLEGPYGNPLTNFEAFGRTVYVFVAGGIGVTPLLSMANQVVFQKFRGKAVDKLFFCWLFREADLPNLVLAPDEFVFSFAEKLDQFYGGLNAGTPKDAVVAELYCTNVDQTETIKLAPSLQPHLKKANLDLAELMKRVEAERKARPRSSVCVVSCGPESMAQQVFSLCKDYGFACHLEKFSY